jgi:hypothetical protein
MCVLEVSQLQRLWCVQRVRLRARSERAHCVHQDHTHQIRERSYVRHVRQERIRLMLVLRYRHPVLLAQQELFLPQDCRFAQSAKRGGTLQVGQQFVSPA